jgi:hypothetical protein
MATRYWVGDGGPWSSANTTNWSATSGGAGGASVPTAADDVVFDANSGSGVVTGYVPDAVCKSLTGASTTGIELSGAAMVSGNVTLDATVVSADFGCSFVAAPPTIKTLKIVNALEYFSLPSGYAVNVDDDATVGSVINNGSVSIRVGKTLTVTEDVRTPTGTPSFKTYVGGSRANINASIGAIVLTNCTAQDIAFGGTSAWYKGDGFVDGGNNTGLLDLPATGGLFMSDF